MQLFWDAGDYWFYATSRGRLKSKQQLISVKHMTDFENTWTTRLRLTYLIGVSSHILPHITGRQIEHVFVTSLGENTGKIIPGFYCTSPLVPLPLDDFNLYCFPGINCNQDTTAFSSLLILGHLLSLWMFLEICKIIGFKYWWILFLFHY